MAIVTPPRRSLLRAFMASSVGTGVSRFLGLARELAMANVLGAGMVMDAFVMAFTFPGMLRRFVADEGLTGALVPAVAKAEEEDGEEAAKALAGRVLSALILSGIVISIAGIIFAPWLVDWVADGFKGEKYALTVDLTRLLFPFVAFVSLVSWAEGLLNHKNHFFVPKIAPGIVSASVVLAVLLSKDTTPIDIIWAVCWAVLIGGAAHLAICLPPLYKRWGVIRPRLDALADDRFRRVLREMGKVAVIGIMAQVNTLVLRYLASHLEEGSVTWYWNATRLVDFAQGIIAVGVGSALLPAISDAVAKGDGDRFRTSFSGAARLAGALLIPAAAFIAAFPVPCVSILYRHGAYNLMDVSQTASALQLLVPFMLSLAGIQIIKKPFFALEKRGALIAVGAMGVALTAGLGMALAPIFGVDGLALALSISTTAQLLAYLIVLRRFVPGGLGMAGLFLDLVRMAIATIPAVLVAQWMIDQGKWAQGPSVENASIMSIALLAGGIIYTVTATLFGVTELKQVKKRIVRRLLRR